MTDDPHDERDEEEFADDDARTFVLVGEEFWKTMMRHPAIGNPHQKACDAAVAAWWRKHA